VEPATQGFGTYVETRGTELDMLSLATPLVSSGVLVDIALAVAACAVAVLALVLVVGNVNRHLAARREHDLHLDLQEQRQDIERREHRLTEREQRLDEEQRALEAREAALGDGRTAQTHELERIAALTATEARAELIGSIEHDAKRTAAVIARDIEKAAKEEAEVRARRVLATVVQRLAAEQTTEAGWPPCTSRRRT
jgi:hypothetical protein